MTMILFSCTRKWTEKDKSEFVSACLSNAVKDDNIGEKNAKEYCDCLVERVVNQYPNANDVQYIKYDKGIVQIGKDCLEKIRPSQGL